MPIREKITSGVIYSYVFKREEFIDPALFNNKEGGEEELFCGLFLLLDKRRELVLFSGDLLLFPSGLAHYL